MSESEQNEISGEFVESRKEILLSAAAPWLATILAIAIGSILIMIGSDMGAKNERQKIANDCRFAGAFSVGRTGFVCEVKK